MQRQGAGLKNEPPSRGQVVECLRVVAAFGIVWFHSHVAGWQIAYAGLSAFIALSCSFTVINRSSRLTLTLVRLLAPWLFWSLIYGIINRVQGDGPNDGAAISMIRGMAPHLWYLPYIAAVIALVTLASRSVEIGLLGRMCAIALMGLLLFIDPSVIHTLPRPLGQWSFALPAVLSGISLGAIRIGATSPIWLATPLVVMADLWFLGNSQYQSHVLGIGLAASAMVLDSAGIFQKINAQRVAKYMFGVYLVHPVMLFAARPIIRLNGGAGLVAAWILSILFVRAFAKAQLKLPGRWRVVSRQVTGI